MAQTTLWSGGWLADEGSVMCITLRRFPTEESAKEPAGDFRPPVMAA
jgi:hypothetical protein